jgi:hypothetical protein
MTASSGCSIDTQTATTAALTTPSCSLLRLLCRQARHAGGDHAGGQRGHAVERLWRVGRRWWRNGRGLDRRGRRSDVRGSGAVVRPYRLHASLKPESEPALQRLATLIKIRVPAAEASDRTIATTKRIARFIDTAILRLIRPVGRCKPLPVSWCRLRRLLLNPDEMWGSCWVCTTPQGGGAGDGARADRAAVHARRQ